MSQKLTELNTSRKSVEEGKSLLSHKLADLIHYQKKLSDVFIEITCTTTEKDLIDNAVSLMRLIMDKINLTINQLNINNDYLGEINKAIEREQNFLNECSQEEPPHRVLEFELPLNNDEIKNLGLFVEYPGISLEDLNLRSRSGAQKIIRDYRYCVAQSFITQILDRADLLTNKVAHDILEKLSAESLE